MKLVAQTCDARGALGLEFLRELSDAELAALDEAEHLLRALTTASPYQRAVDARREMGAAFAGLLSDATESQDLRMERAENALRRVFEALTAAPAELEKLKREGEPPSDGVDGEPLLWGERAWVLLRELRGEHKLRLAVGTGEIVVVRDGGKVRIELLVDLLLQDLTVLMAEVLVHASDAVDSASRVVLALEKEVLFGQGALSDVPEMDGEGRFGGKLMLRELPRELVNTAQAATRQARDVLRTTATTGREASAGVSEAGATDAPVADRCTVDAALPPGSDPLQNAAQATVATGHDEPLVPAEAGQEQTGQASLGEDLHPPVDLQDVVQHLVGGMLAVERAYGERPRLDEMWLAVEEDRAAFSSLLRQLALSLQRTVELGERSGAPEIRLNVPPTDDDLLALDASPSGQVRLRQAMLAEVLATQALLEGLEDSQRLVSATIGPGGVVTTAAFDPGGPDRLRGLLLQSGRVARHRQAAVGAVSSGQASANAASSARAVEDPDAGAENEWLHEAATQCAGRGLHEAALLYLSALAARSSSVPALPQQVWSTAATALSNVASGRTEDAAAVAATLVAVLLPSLADRKDVGRGATPAAHAAGGQVNGDEGVRGGSADSGLADGAPNRTSE